MNKVIMCALVIVGTLSCAEPESLGRRIIVSDGLLRPSEKEFTALAALAPLVANLAADFQGDVDLQDTGITKQSIELMIEYLDNSSRWTKRIQQLSLEDLVRLAQDANFLLAEDYLAQIIKSILDNLGRMAQNTLAMNNPEQLFGALIVNDDVRQKLAQAIIQEHMNNKLMQQTSKSDGRLFSISINPSGSMIGLGVTRKRTEDPEQFFMPLRKQEPQLLLIDTKDLAGTVESYRTNFAPTAQSWSGDDILAYNDGSRLRIRFLSKRTDIEQAIRTTPLKSIAFRPGTTQLVVADIGTAVYLFNYQTRSLEQFAQLNGRVNSMSFTKTGDLLAIGTTDGVLTIASMNNKKQSTFKGPESAVSSVSFKPDGTALAALYTNGQVAIWAGKTYKLLPLPEIQKEGTIAWSPSGRYLALGRADGSLTILEASTFSVLISRKISSKECIDLSWSDNDTLAWAYADGAYGIINCSTITNSVQAIAAIDDPALLMLIHVTRYGSVQLTKAQRDFFNKRLNSIQSAQARDLIRSWYQSSTPETKWGTRQRSD